MPTFAPVLQLSPGKPSGSTVESFSRLSCPDVDLPGCLTSGTVLSCGIVVPAGTVVAGAKFLSGTTPTTLPLNQWVLFADKNRVGRAVSADLTTTAWAGNSLQAFTMTSSYTVPTTDMYYLMIMIKATTTPSLCGMLDFNTAINALTPVTGGTADAGQTTPPGLPFTAASLTATSPQPYFFLT